MTFAMVEGARNTLLQTTSQCPSTLCSWPEYRTLGLCNSCTDVSEDLTVQCEDQFPGYPESESESQTCNYTTPSGLRLHADIGVSGTFYRIQGRLATSIVLPWSEGNGSNSYLPQNAQFARFSSIYFGNSLAFPRDPERNITDLPSPTVYQCELSWCERIFANTRSQNGTLDDEPTASRPLQVDESCVDDISVETPEDVICTARPASLAPRQSQEDSYTTTSVYSLNIWDIWELQKQFSWDFSANGGEDTRANGGIPTALRALSHANEGNISRAMGGVAMGVTNRLREGVGAATVVGQVTLPLTVVRVNWPWMIFPAALSVLAAVFLVAVMGISVRRGDVLWKSSLLPLLFLD